LDYCGIHLVRVFQASPLLGLLRALARGISIAARLVAANLNALHGDWPERLDSNTQQSAVNGQPKIGKNEYEAELFKLQVDLVKLQDWVKSTNARIVIVFEGRDAAGKGGMIKRILERVTPRIYRVVALPAPTERQKTQIPAQRYIGQLPAGGEVVIFHRSWYNCAGVEYVMGFCTDEEHREFLRDCPIFEGLSGQPGHYLSEVLARSIGKGTAQALPRAN
jgi:polyphosphate kinase 2 (PPK2 family)